MKKKKKKNGGSRRVITTMTKETTIAEKEVFASGDKIMVSVNFKTNDKSETPKSSAVKEASSKKPSVVIDVMSSPYQVIEPSPKEVIDVFSDGEEAVDIIVEQELPVQTNAAVTEEEVVDKEVEKFDLSRGPQTPPPNDDDDGGSDSYDPCDPTESPIDNDVTDNGATDSLLKTVVNSIPFLLEENNGHQENGGGGGDKNDLPVDMDMDSPFSPQSSEMSDIFEPPLNTPLTNKKLNAAAASKRGKAGKTKKTQRNKNSIHMKIIDDQLRIIDDVPTSAVEMAVKEKFLKKVQRQERIVEEIKMVLKPHYNRKRIGKEEYKDILRKCVPKVISF